MNTYLKQLGKDICPSKGKWPVKKWKSAPVEFVPWALVPSYPYLVLNTTSIRWIHIDVDLEPGWERLGFHPAFDSEIFDQYSLQFPNWSVHSKNSFHMIWRLRRSFPLVGSAVSMAFLYDVRRKILEALNGDSSCPVRNVSFKNPAYKGHQYRYWGSHCHFLDKLNIDVDVSQGGAGWTNSKYGRGQRNEATFYAVLSWWKEGGQRASFDEMLDFITSYQECFTDTPPLSHAENTAIAKSILRNGDRYKTRADRNYGAMKLPEAKWREMSFEERKAEIRRRQRLGAKFTHKKRQLSTRQRIEASVEHIRKTGGKLTANAVADHSGVSYRTVCSKIKIKRGKVVWK